MLLYVLLHPYKLLGCLTVNRNLNNSKISSIKTLNVITISVRKCFVNRNLRKNQPEGANKYYQIKYYCVHLSNYPDT